MNSLGLFLICFVAWIVWIPAASLQKAARGESAGVSIFPVIPLFPLIAWSVGLGLNWLQSNLGFYVVGGLHIVLSVVHVGMALVYVFRVREKGK